MTTDRLPVVSPSVEVADFDTELVVLVPGRRAAHHLEPDAAILFDSCRRGHSMDAVVAELATATGQDPAAVADWVRFALSEFADKGLFDTAEG